MLLLYSLIALFVTIYVGLTFIVGFGFKNRLNTVFSKEQKWQSGLSIIVPYRNEASTLPHFLTQLLNANLPEVYELILVNDDSSDSSEKICESFAHKGNIVCLNSLGIGKKQALKTGIMSAQYNCILTLDADVLLSAHCVQLMYDKFQTEGLSMLCGLVKFKPSNNLFEQLQAIELSVMVAYSAMSLDNGMPSTCNGACLMFKRDVFMALGGYDAHQTLASGDDDLLLQSFFKAYPEQVKYMNHAEAYVMASTCSSSKAFIQQRMRWTSKHKAYFYPYNAILSRILALRFLLFWVLVFATIIYASLWSGLGVLVILLSEWISLKVMNSFFKCKSGVVFLLSLYFWYLPCLLLNVGSDRIQWKGRSI
jgi:cellulose synthase/poly-beta-1,6-N-acetylglucosamine synthase-like glycosyltransferase